MYLDIISISHISYCINHLHFALHSTVIINRYCFPSHPVQRLKARKASMAELQSIHSENHVRLYARPTQRKPGVEKKDSGRAFIQLSCGGMGVDRDTYWNEQHTSNTARMVWERELLHYVCTLYMYLNCHLWFRELDGMGMGFIATCVLC